MNARDCLIAELEVAIERGWDGTNSDILRRVTDLFLASERYDDEQIALYDDVLGRLIVNIETRTLAELSQRLAPVGHAPPNTIRELAGNDEVVVAGPVLTQSSRLDESILVNIAQSKSQAHLLAISARKRLDEPLTDVLVQRGDEDVARSVAANPGASFSDPGYDTLTERADTDPVLAETIVRRPEVPLRVYCALVARAGDVVRERLLAATRSEAHPEIRRAVDRASGEMADKAPTARDYVTALRNIVLAHSEGKLRENDVLRLARAKRFEETVAAISILSSVPIEVVAESMYNDSANILLTLCKTAEFEWPTVREIVQLRSSNGLSSERLVELCKDFARLSELSNTTARTILQFWQSRLAIPAS